jgi:hypothetical protein
MILTDLRKNITPAELESLLGNHRTGTAKDPTTQRSRHCGEAVQLRMDKVIRIFHSLEETDVADARRAFAVAFHGFSRYTADLDLFVRPIPLAAKNCSATSGARAVPKIWAMRKSCASGPSRIAGPRRKLCVMPFSRRLPRKTVGRN